jgi:hypothetical protein
VKHVALDAISARRRHQSLMLLMLMLIGGGVNVHIVFGKGHLGKESFDTVVTATA